MNRYLRERTWCGPLIAEAPSADLGLAVVIPCKDEPDLRQALDSLHACEPPSCAVEVITVVNTGAHDGQRVVAQNRDCARRARKWAEGRGNERRRFFVLEQHGLPRKHAGVGLARKIGMDEACRRLEQVGRPRGVIACFDADSRCDPNYLVELERLFEEDESCQAASVFFEHPVEGDDHPAEVYEAIVRYELHLRYFVEAQRWAGFPLAVQTIGSSMAVRCDAYQQQNGMNKRKAGEDFYFLHKFTPLGGVRELNSTRVIPSPRASHRVPFGTGRAVGEMLSTSVEEYRTYAPESFGELRVFLSQVNDLYETGHGDWPGVVAEFLESLHYLDRLDEIRRNVKSRDTFRRRFFRWFNGFQVMKFLHFARDRGRSDVPVTDAARWLLAERGERVAGCCGPPELLERYRRSDRGGQGCRNEKAGAVVRRSSSWRGRGPGRAGPG